MKSCICVLRITKDLASLFFDLVSNNFIYPLFKEGEIVLSLDRNLCKNRCSNVSSANIIISLFYRGSKKYIVCVSRYTTYAGTVSVWHRWNWYDKYADMLQPAWIFGAANNRAARSLLAETCFRLHDLVEFSFFDRIGMPTNFPPFVCRRFEIRARKKKGEEKRKCSRLVEHLLNF